MPQDSAVGQTCILCARGAGIISNKVTRLLPMCSSDTANQIV